MLIIRDKSLIPEKYFGSVVALGNFDGLHLGHQEVVGKAVSFARAAGKPSAMVTFEPNPRRIFKPDLPTLRIISFAEKARILKNAGINFMRVIHFTRAFSETTAEAFIKDILIGQLKISHIVTGDDFIFGHNREGNVEYLKEMAESEGFFYTVCPQVMVGNERCSSTRIRTLLSEGKVEGVSSLLGRSYSISGIVRSGDKRGRQLGFPTANILPGRIFTPKNGVYAVKVKIRGELINGVANIGVRPTFNGTRLQLEVHMFDWEKDIYGEHMETIFVKHIRNEQKFDGIESLKKQISEDCSQAKTMLNSYKL